MNTAPLQDFDAALLRLDAAMKKIIDRPHPSERGIELRDARRDFLVTAAPMRLHALVAATMGLAGRHDAASRDAVLSLVKRVLRLAEEAGVPRADLVAVFNNETIEHQS